MDFIERIFGVSIDGGSGALELAILLVPLAILATSTWRGAMRRRAASQQAD